MELKKLKMAKNCCKNCIGNSMSHDESAGCQNVLCPCHQVKPKECKHIDEKGMSLWEGPMWNTILQKCKSCGISWENAYKPSPIQSWEKRLRSILDNYMPNEGMRNLVIRETFAILSTQRTELLKVVEETKKRFRCGACDGAKCGHTLGCQAIEDIIKKIK